MILVAQTAWKNVLVQKQHSWVAEVQVQELVQVQVQVQVLEPEQVVQKVLEASVVECASICYFYSFSKRNTVVDELTPCLQDAPLRCGSSRSEGVRERRDNAGTL